MRDLLTYIGIALIALLSAAFAAPYVVDFDDYRARIAEEISSTSGMQVAFNGPISLRLLPTPRFAAQKLVFSGDFGAARAEKAFFELSLPALIQGRLQFSAARFDGAEITIATDMAMRLATDAAAQIDDLVLRDAKLTLSQAGAPALRLDILDLAAQASSLAGPFKGHGALDVAGRTVAFTFASDVFAKGLLPLKANLTWPGEIGRLELDGRLNFTAKPLFEGKGKAAGQAEAGSWQAQSGLVARFDGVEAENFSARLGQGELLGPLSGQLSGKGRFEAATGRISLDLAAPEIAEPWAASFIAPLLAASASKAPLDLHFAAETFDWRGVAWSHARFDRQPGAVAHVQAQGPGQSRLDFSAAPDKTSWRGKGEFKAEDFPAFAAALRDAAPLAGLKFRVLDLSGDFLVSPDEFALTGLNLRLDQARLAGDAHFKPERSGRRPLLTARLAAPALDLDAAPELGDTWSDTWIAAIDLDLSLEAQTVKLARNGHVYGETGRIKAHFLRNDDAATLEKLELRNIGGGDLSVSGGWGRDFAGLKGEARLKAADFSELAQVLARITPGPATKALAARGKILSPVDLTAKAGGEGKGFELAGASGGTKISASLAPRADGKFAAALDLAAPDGGVLLNQLGAPVLLAQKIGPAHVTAKAQSDGSATEKLSLSATGDVAGLHGEFRGLAGDPLAAPSLDGDLVLSGDLAKILASFALAPPGPQPARLSTHLTGQPGALKLQNLAGAWGDDKFAGEMSVDGEGIGGTLSCDRLSAPALVALVLGPPAPVKQGALWSSLSFAPVLSDPPRAKLGVETADLLPFGGKARFDLAVGPGFLALSQATLDGFGGVLRGGFDLRREGAQVTLSGDVEGADFSLKNQAFSAKLDGNLHFAGNGGNAAALIGSLAGGGAAKARSVVVAGAAAAAPDEALAASEASEAPFDAALVAKSLDENFARDEFRLAEADFSVRLAAGRLTMTQENSDPPTLEAAFDLRDANTTLALSVTAQKKPGGWTESLPSGKVVWIGPWSAPLRRVDATGFVNAVAARALEREQARIEVLKAQDRQRLRALSAPQPE